MEKIRPFEDRYSFRSYPVVLGETFTTPVVSSNSISL